MNDLVSVIVPTYNRSGVLPRAVDSALAQTHGRVEVVVVDDGSTDGTEAMVARRYGGDARVRYLRQVNAGVSAARNRAMKAATGDYLAFLDSDDAWKPSKLEMQLACFRAFPEAGMVWTDMEAIDPAGAVSAPRYLRTMYAESYRWFPGDSLFSKSATIEAEGGPVRAFSGTIFPQIMMGNLVHTSTVVVRRERFKKVGFFDVSHRLTGEDYDYHLRTSREGPVAFLDAVTVSYQIGMPGALTARSRAMAKSFLRTITEAQARERHRIDLPPWMLREVFRRAHAWVAEEAIAAGDVAEGRQHYLKSLAHAPWQPRAYAQLALGALPPGAAGAARGLWHRLKRVWQPA